MEYPAESAFVCRQTGIDKAAVVRTLLEQGREVAFAGDGFPDIEAARLVAPGRRFARADLAAVCQEEGLPFRRFEAWTEVAAALIEDAIR